LISIQILLNPAKATKSNLAGIAHVVSRMDWYCALTEYFLENDHVDKSFKSALPQLKAKILELYKALLLYQMKSACSYYRHRGLVFLRGLANWDDWDADMKTVTDAENDLKMDLKQYNELHSKKALAQLVERAEVMEGLLGDIHQTLQDFITQQKADKDDKCLQDLFVVDPQDDLEKIENKKDTLLDGAYKWIIDTDEYAAFTNWSNDGLLPFSRLMWVKGDAGTGKTHLRDPSWARL
jgi:hypothetical protein